MLEMLNKYFLNTDEWSITMLSNECCAGGVKGTYRTPEKRAFYGYVNQDPVTRKCVHFNMRVIFFHT
jgi:hypothetical protein